MAGFGRGAKLKRLGAQVESHTKVSPETHTGGAIRGKVTNVTEERGVVITLVTLSGALVRDITDEMNHEKERLNYGVAHEILHFKNGSSVLAVRRSQETADA